MVPLLFVELENLPVAASGKIDKSLLPDPDLSKPLHNQYVAPRNEAERQMSKIWAEVLKVEKISMHDNFFELGGHSLMILKLVSQVRKLGLQIDVKDFFAYQTIEEQSNFIKTTLKLFDAAKEGNFVIPVQTEGPNAPLFAFPEFLLYSEISKHIDNQQPFYAIEHSPFKTSAEIVDHYIAEIKKVRPHGPYCLAGYCNWGKIAVEMAHRLIEMGDKVPALVLIEYYSPKIHLSRVSLKFIRAKINFILNKLRKEVSFVDKGKFLSREFVYALQYMNSKIARTGVQERIPGSNSYSGKVILFQAGNTYGFKEDPHMGWDENFTGEVKKYKIPGEHLSIMTGAQAAQIAEILNVELAGINSVTPFLNINNALQVAGNTGLTQLPTLSNS
jgi:thioesterase domain-containing protein/acyl carrier protein